LAVSKETTQKHHYRRHFQGCHDRIKLCKKRTLQINGKHFTLRINDMVVRLAAV